MSFAATCCRWLSSLSLEAGNSIISALALQNFCRMAFKHADRLPIARSHSSSYSSPVSSFYSPLSSSSSTCSSSSLPPSSSSVAKSSSSVSSCPSALSGRSSRSSLRLHGSSFVMGGPAMGLASSSSVSLAHVIVFACGMSCNVSTGPSAWALALPGTSVGVIATIVMIGGGVYWINSEKPTALGPDGVEVLCAGAPQNPVCPSSASLMLDAPS